MATDTIIRRQEAYNRYDGPVPLSERRRIAGPELAIAEAQAAVRFHRLYVLNDLRRIRNARKELANPTLSARQVAYWEDAIARARIDMAYGRHNHRKAVAHLFKVRGRAQYRSAAE